MVTKASLIFRDVMYAVLVVVLLLPSNPLNVTNIMRVLAVVFAIGVRIWQHVTYYKQTGKIY